MFEHKITGIVGFLSIIVTVALIFGPFSSKIDLDIIRSIASHIRQEQII